MSANLFHHYFVFLSANCGSYIESKLNFNRAQEFAFICVVHQYRLIILCNVGRLSRMRQTMNSIEPIYSLYMNIEFIGVKDWFELLCSRSKNGCHCDVVINGKKLFWIMKSGLHGPFWCSLILSRQLFGKLDLSLHCYKLFVIGDPPK